MVFRLDISKRRVGDRPFDYDRDIPDGMVSTVIVHQGHEGDPSVIISTPQIWRRRVMVMASMPAPEESNTATLLELAQSPAWEGFWWQMMRTTALHEIHSPNKDAADLGVSLLAFVLCHQPGATVGVEHWLQKSVERFGKAVIVLACRRCVHGSLLIRTIADRRYRADLVAEWFARTDCGDAPDEDVGARESSSTLH